MIFAWMFLFYFAFDLPLRWSVGKINAFKTLDKMWYFIVHRKSYYDWPNVCTVLDVTNIGTVYFFLKNRSDIHYIQYSISDCYGECMANHNKTLCKLYAYGLSKHRVSERANKLTQRICRKNDFPPLSWHFKDVLTNLANSTIKMKPKW